MKNFFVLLFLIIFSLATRSETRTDTLQFGRMGNKFYIVSDIGIKYIDKNEIKCSECYIIDNRKNVVEFYNALLNCYIIEDGDSLVVKLKFDLPTLLSSQKKSGFLYSDIYYYDQNQSKRSVRLHKDFLNYPPKTIKNMNNRFRFVFKNGLDKTNRLSLLETSNWIECLFIGAINGSEESAKYLLNFPNYFNKVIDGELAETLHEYQALYRKLK